MTPKELFGRDQSHYDKDYRKEKKRIRRKIQKIYSFGKTDYDIRKNDAVIIGDIKMKII